MKRSCEIFLGALLTTLILALASPLPASGQDVRAPRPKHKQPRSIAWVRGYLLEVKKHLKKSFVEAGRITDQGLLEACLSGLDRALKADVHKDLPEEAASGLHALFVRKDYKNISAVLAALDDRLTEHPVPGLDLETLADVAAKRMVESVQDPYSHIFSFDELQKMMNLLGGQSRDDSLGLAIVPKGGKFEVGYVMYGYPAYWAGIEMGDEVLAIGGTDVRKMSLKEMGEDLKAKPGESVSVTVQRAGWLHPYEFELTQRDTRHRDVLFKVLPGEIGYLRLTIFDTSLESSVKGAVEKMAAKGIRGLILDLRHNPGGALNAAVGVADQFIPGDSLITHTQSNYQIEMPIKIPGLEAGLTNDFHAGRKFRSESYPMVVLVDRATASASELLSGALQDLKRARIIGETTYGKGVGQTAIPLWNTMSRRGLLPVPERYLYLTVMTYTLPTGRSIHHKGVEPDVRVPAPRPGAEEFERLWTLRRDGAVRKYVESAFADRDDLAKELAIYDRFETSRYPGFDEFYRGLGTELTRDQVRDEVRRELRLAYESRTGATLVCDLETDVQLQQGLMDLAETMGLEGDGAETK